MGAVRGGGGDDGSDDDWDDDSFEWSESEEEDEEMGFDLFGDFTGDTSSNDKAMLDRESEPEELTLDIAKEINKPRILENELEPIFTAQQQVR